MNDWLDDFAWVSVGLGCMSFVIILLDIAMGRRQKMWIMDIVWPVTGLYSGMLGLVAYFAIGRPAGKSRSDESREKPFWQQVVVAATHCGSGCALGDILAEWVVFAAPLIIFGRKLFGTWVVDFAMAYLIGIVFQFFSIVPMRQLSTGKGILAAIRADTFSLIAWQLGMYGWMAIVVFLLFHRELPPTDPVYWFMMQVAMLIGFATAYPVNWWLLKMNWKEKM